MSHLTRIFPYIYHKFPINLRHSSREQERPFVGGIFCPMLWLFSVVILSQSGARGVISAMDLYPLHEKKVERKLQLSWVSYQEFVNRNEHSRFENLSGFISLGVLEWYFARLFKLLVLSFMSRELALTTLDGDAITHKVDLVTTVGEFKTMLLQHKPKIPLSAKFWELNCFKTVQSWKWMMLRSWAKQACWKVKLQLSSTKETKWKLQPKLISRHRGSFTWTSLPIWKPFLGLLSKIAQT